DARAGGGAGFDGERAAVERDQSCDGAEGMRLSGGQRAGVDGGSAGVSVVGVSAAGGVQAKRAGATEDDGDIVLIGAGPAAAARVVGGRSAVGDVQRGDTGIATENGGNGAGAAAGEGCNRLAARARGVAKHKHTGGGRVPG